jgi:putative PIN family toxin of toxin-antitoxin system
VAVRIVLDTSVLVAAWRSRLAASFEILEAVGGNRFEIAVSVSLVAEYEAALLRHLVGAQRPRHVEALVDHLCAVAVRQKVFFLWRPLLADPNDDMVVEVAIASQASAIVTHNVRDFAPARRLGVQILAPGAFLNHVLRS